MTHVRESYVCLSTWTPSGVGTSPIPRSHIESLPSRFTGQPYSPLTHRVSSQQIHWTTLRQQKRMLNMSPSLHQHTSVVWYIFLSWFFPKPPIEFFVSSTQGRGIPSKKSLVHQNTLLCQLQRVTADESWSPLCQQESMVCVPKQGVHRLRLLPSMSVRRTGLSSGGGDNANIFCSPLRIGVAGVFICLIPYLVPVLVCVGDKSLSLSLPAYCLLSLLLAFFLPHYITLPVRSIIFPSSFFFPFQWDFPLILMIYLFIFKCSLF